MTPEQRRAAVDALPAAMTEAELTPSEGDSHFDAKAEGKDTLKTYFSRSGKRVYVAAELSVYYPDEDRFSPDLLAVWDVDTQRREKWVVSAEGKGLDWGLEVLVSGSRRKDLERNVTRYARLLIPEYFVFDRKRASLHGWRLQDPKVGVYTPIVQQRGVLHSEVLGLDLAVQDRNLRFWQSNAQILAPQELIASLEDHVTNLVIEKEEVERLLLESERLRAEVELQVQRAEERVEEERKRVEEERKRAEAAERRADRLQAELDRLRGRS